MRSIKPDTDDYAEASTGGMKAKQSEPRYPTVRLEHRHVPEAKKWSVGKTYPVKMHLKMVGNSDSRFDKSAEFEIRKIDTAPDSVADEAGAKGGRHGEADQ